MKQYAYAFTYYVEIQQADAGKLLKRPARSIYLQY